MSFDPQQFGQFVREVGLGTATLIGLGYAIYRSGKFLAPRLERFLEAHLAYLNRTAETGEKQSEILDRIDGKVDHLHAKFDRFQAH